MKKTIHIDVKEPQYMVNTNVTFAQVPAGAAISRRI